MELFLLMRPEKYNESGQATVELCVGLIAIMVAFSGILFLSALGIENVRALITARENADAMNGAITPTHISSWDYGEDTIPFSADDTPIASPGSNEMDEELVTSFMNMTTDQHTSSHPFVTDSRSDQLFLDAVHLQGASGNAGNLDERLPNMMNAIEYIFHLNDIDLVGQDANQVFMPEPSGSDAPPPPIILD